MNKRAFDSTRTVPSDRKWATSPDFVIPVIEMTRLVMNKFTCGVDARPFHKVTTEGGREDRGAVR